MRTNNQVNNSYYLMLALALGCLTAGQVWAADGSGNSIKHQLSAADEDKIVVGASKKPRLELSPEEQARFNRNLIAADNVAAVIAALEAGADVNARDGENCTALIIAAQYQNAEIVATLLRQNADPNLQNERGETALMQAVYFCQVENVKLLLQCPTINTALRTNNRKNAFQIACNNGPKRYNPEIVRMLLAANADTSVLCKIMQMRLAANGDTSVLPSEDGAILTEAATGGSCEIVQLLLRDPKITRNRDSIKNALESAVIFGETHITSLLLDYGSKTYGLDINAQEYTYDDRDGATLLMIATQYARTEVVKLLLNLNADIHLLTAGNDYDDDDHGYTAFYTAILGARAQEDFLREKTEDETIDWHEHARKNALRDLQSEDELVGLDYIKTVTLLLNACDGPHLEYHRLAVHDADLVAINTALEQNKNALLTTAAAGNIAGLYSALDNLPTLNCNRNLISQALFKFVATPTEIPIDQFTRTVRDLLDRGADINYSAEVVIGHRESKGTDDGIIKAELTVLDRVMRRHNSERVRLILASGARPMMADNTSTVLLNTLTDNVAPDAEESILAEETSTIMTMVADCALATEFVANPALGKGLDCTMTAGVKDYINVLKERQTMLKEREFMQKQDYRA